MICLLPHRSVFYRHVRGGSCFWTPQCAMNKRHLDLRHLPSALVRHWLRATMGCHLVRRWLHWKRMRPWLHWKRRQRSVNSSKIVWDASKCPHLPFLYNASKAFASLKIEIYIYIYIYIIIPCIHAKRCSGKLQHIYKNGKDGRGKNLNCCASYGGSMVIMLVV